MSSAKKSGSTTKRPGQSILSDAVHLDVDVFRRPAAHAIAHPPADDQGPATSVSGGTRNMTRDVE